DAEIEVSPVRDFEEAGGAQVLIVALAVDIGPELARSSRDSGLAQQIFASLDDRWGEAEVEAEQGRLLGRAHHQPAQDVLARPDVARPDQPWSRVVPRFGDRNALVAPSLCARPVNRNIAFEPPHLRLRGRTFGRAAVQSRDREMTPRTRASSAAS